MSFPQNSFDAIPDYSRSKSTTEDAAKDIAAFVAMFFEIFSQFKGRGFHLTGESYGVSNRDIKDLKLPLILNP